MTKGTQLFLCSRLRCLENREDFDPWGRLTIAQRFIAAEEGVPNDMSVPWGRLNRNARFSTVPTGLFGEMGDPDVPVVNCWAIVACPCGTVMWVKTRSLRRKRPAHP